MKMRWTLLIVALFLMTACGKKIPGDIIQPDKMEEVLYDYHLALGMSSNVKNTEKEAYRNFVFEKHRISEAMFESSMEWYARDAQELTDIYTRLNKRFQREHEQLDKLLENRQDAGGRMALSGDSVNIWRKDEIHWLSDVPLKNKLVFEIKADTTFHAGDAFSWNMDFDLLTNTPVVAGLNVKYENDSVISEVKNVSRSGSQVIYLHSATGWQIKSLDGFVYVPKDSLDNTGILLYNVSLTRYHLPVPDSLMVDSIRSSGSEREIIRSGQIPLERKLKVERPKK